MTKQEVTKQEEPKAHVLNGNGGRAISLPPRVKGFSRIQVLDGEEWAALPQSDVTIQGSQLVISQTPSGAYSVWPKGEANVRVKE